MEVLSLLAFLVLAGLNWVAVARKRTAVEYLTKPAALAMLTIFATTGPDPSGLLIAALVLSLLGDVYLMVPGNLFIAGLSAFLLAHVAYIADFEGPVGVRVLWWIVVMAASSPIALRILRAVTDGVLRVAVTGYMAVIGFMVASALTSGSVFATLGALLFFASDALIAWDRFVEPKTWARPAIMITYHVGQLFLVIVLRLG